MNKDLRNNEAMDSDTWAERAAELDGKMIDISEKVLGNIPEEYRDEYITIVNEHHDFLADSAKTIGREKGEGFNRGFLCGIIATGGAVVTGIVGLIFSGKMRHS